MAEKKDEKQKKSGLRKFVEVSAASSIPFAVGSPLSKILTHLGNMPARSDVDKAMNLRLLDVAKSRGIEVRRGAKSGSESYVYPEKVRKAILRAKEFGYPLTVRTPEGPRPLTGLLGRKIIWLEKDLNTNPAQFAHELGHVPAGVRHPNWKHLTITIPKVLTPAAALATAGIGAARAKTPEQAERAGKAGALVGLLGGLPSLVSEALASTKGLRLMHEQGATKGQLLRLGTTRMLPHFGTYALMAAAPALASYLIGKMVAKHKREAEKTAAEREKKRDKEKKEVDGEVSPRKALLLALGTAPAAAVAQAGLYYPAMDALTKVHPKDAQLLQSMADEARARGVQFAPGSEMSPASAIYRTPEGTLKPTVIVPGQGISPGAVGHELGHLRGMSPKRFMYTQFPMHFAYMGKTPAALMTTGIGSLASSTPEGAERAGLAGSIVGAGLATPRLLEEAYASGRGLMTMRRHGADLGALGRGATGLAPAWGTYALGAIPAVAMPYLIGRAVAAYRRRAAKRKAEKKEPKQETKQ
jgi:hypothetical protein